MPGKQDGKAYVRNQRLNAPQNIQQLKPDGLGLHSNAHPHNDWMRGTPEPVDVAGREATVKNCGVTGAMLQGHSWAPTPSNGRRVNVGTVSLVPESRRAAATAGKARCQLIPTGRGGGPVVVRGRESRSHGEGVQRDRGRNSERGGCW